MNTGINPLRLGLAVAMFGLLPISAQAERWNRCRDCGFVRSVERIEERGDSHLGGGTVLGAIVGGALGNQVGKGDGRKAATLAGALIGGSIGHDSARRNGYGYYESDGGYYSRGYEERCRTETRWRGEREVVGYNVTYRYAGRTYRTQLDHDPGERLRVRVDSEVTPAE